MGWDGRSIRRRNWAFTWRDSIRPLWRPRRFMRHTVAGVGPPGLHEIQTVLGRFMDTNRDWGDP